MPPIEGSDRAAKTFYLMSPNGVKIFPVRMKDLKTGRIAFRLAIPGRRANTRENVIEVEDESTAYQMAASRKYIIRAQREGERGPGYYRVGGRIAKDIVLMGASSP